MNEISHAQRLKFYDALVRKDPKFDGVFFVGVTTTSVFCHATCRAKKPKLQNCEFFTNAQDALLAGYRPCKICTPLSYPNELPDEVKTLIKAVEDEPDKRWKDSDFDALGIHSARARRKFLQIYGMTFVQYARARRLGLAFGEILRGKRVLEVGVEANFSSLSGFNDAFSKIFKTSPKRVKQGVVKILSAEIFATPLGRMIAISDENGLWLLEFLHRRGLEREIERLKSRLNAQIIAQKCQTNECLVRELDEYFAGKRGEFSVNLNLLGSEFERRVWAILRQIPAGQTKSYAQVANLVGQPNAVRAVGRANGANQISILIPCHRVVRSNGDLGGYGGGLEAKAWLLNLEKKIATQQNR